MNILAWMRAFMRALNNLSLTYTLTAGILILFIWACFFSIDQTIVVPGQVASDRRTQIIQAVDGGVLTGLKVQEGGAVSAGETLATLEKDVAAASYGAALAELESSRATLSSIEAELQLTQALLKTEDVGYLEVARLKRQVIDIVGRVKINQKKLEQQQILLDRLSLKSPIDGYVKLIKINTVGGVLRPGEEILEISPKLDSLLIEAKINTADIGSVKLGMPASIKIDAFEYVVYGGLNGVVSYISSDSISEQSAGGLSNTYYKVRIDIPADQLILFNRQEVDLRLGMSATVSIKTGSRSVLKYLMKPIYKGFEGALHEK